MIAGSNVKIMKTSNLIKSAVLAIIFSLLTSCALIDRVIDPVASGYKPIVAPSFVLAELNNSIAYSFSPIYERTNNSIRTYIYSFDGTENYKDAIKSNNDRETIAYYLHKQIKLYHDIVVDRQSSTTALGDEHSFQARLASPDCGEKASHQEISPIRICYVPGAGKQYENFTDKLDSIFGFSSEKVAQAALADLDNWLARDPPPRGGELRVVVIGYSRGAASARHFLNLIYQKYLLNGQARTGSNNAQIWSYGLLFDTVPTFNRRLMLSVPPNVEHLVHFVAKDERRDAFEPYVDEDDGYRDPLKQPRILTQFFPGAHADIGNGYALSAGHFLRIKAQYLLARMGLTGNPDENLGRTATFITDSRGWWDRYFNSNKPYTCDADGKQTLRHFKPEKTILNQQDHEILVSRQSTKFRSFLSARADSKSSALPSASVTVHPGLFGTYPINHPIIHSIEISKSSADQIKLTINTPGRVLGEVILAKTESKLFSEKGGLLEISLAEQSFRNIEFNESSEGGPTSLFNLYLDQCLVY